MTSASTPARRRNPPGPPPTVLFGISRHRPARLVIACVFGAVSVFPLLFMVAQSFTPLSETLGGTPTLLPAHPTLSNYPAAWTANSFGQYFLNSGYVSAATVVINVAFASLKLIDYPGDTSPNDKYFARDVVTNPFTMADGRIRPNRGPGIGVEVDGDFLAASTLRTWKLS